MRQKTLIVEPKDSNFDLAVSAARKNGNQILRAVTSEQALAILQNEPIDIVIANHNISGSSGLEILRYARAKAPPIPVILISEDTSVDATLEAFRQGATYQVTDPIDVKELRIALRYAQNRRRMHQSEPGPIEEKAQEKSEFGFLQGASSAMQKVFEQIQHSAPFKTTVLITGESGTGKELVARSLHGLSPVSKGPFIAINCSAIPRELVESQLFGHEKGSFTSAVARQQGVFEAAHGGTLLLDEIADLAPEAQAKLLRALESRQITPLGSTAPIDVDVRLLAATNTDLKRAVHERRFREDLYYRLNVLNIHLPPLRDRIEDIPLLIRVFLDRFAEENQTRPKQISPDALKHLIAYGWPGNVRELKNITERLAVIARGETIDSSDLPSEFQSLPNPVDAQTEIDLNPFTGMSLEQIEHMVIAHTLDQNEGNRTRTAKTLGISLRTLQRKIKEYSIDVHE